MNRTVGLRLKESKGLETKKEKPSLPLAGKVILKEESKGRKKEDPEKKDGSYNLKKTYPIEDSRNSSGNRSMPIKEAVNLNFVWGLVLCGFLGGGLGGGDWLGLGWG